MDHHSDTGHKRYYSYFDTEDHFLRSNSIKKNCIDCTTCKASTSKSKYKRMVITGLQLYSQDTATMRDVPIISPPT